MPKVIVPASSASAAVPAGSVRSTCRSDGQTPSPETFGAGVRHFDQPVVGGVTIAPHYEAAKSGFQLLAETVSKVAEIGSQTAEKVVDANNAASLMQMKLQASTAYTEQNLAREARSRKGRPGRRLRQEGAGGF